MRNLNVKLGKTCFSFIASGIVFILLAFYSANIRFGIECLGACPGITSQAFQTSVLLFWIGVCFMSLAAVIGLYDHSQRRVIVSADGTHRATRHSHQ